MQTVRGDYGGVVDGDVAASLQMALVGATDWHAVASSLRDQGGEGLAPHQAAFSYIYVEQANTDYRARYGPLGPLWEMQGNIYPAPLDHLPAGALESWADAFSSIGDPLLRSRYGDLLWLVRAGDAPHQYGHAAVDAYTILADGDDGLLTATHAAQRGIELALELNDQRALADLAARSVTRAARLLSLGPDRPGAVMRLLEAVADLSPGSRPASLLATALLAEQTYEANTNVGDAIADLLASITPDPAAIEAIRRRQLARWQTLIATTSGIVLQAHLQHAMELAALHQLTDIREDLRRTYQAAQATPLELHELGVEVSVPAADLDRMIATFVGDDTAIDALRRLASYSPAGDPADVRAFVTEQMNKNPIRFLATGVLIGDDNMTIRYLRTPDEHFEAQLRAHEELRIRTFAAAVLKPALVKIVDRYGTPDQASLQSALASTAIDAALAATLGQGVGEFFVGAHDRSAHLIVPRLERGLRELGRRAGVIVVREPIGDRPGGVRPLGGILSDLTGVIPEDWRRYFANLLTDELGINIRNRVAHGLVDQVPDQDAALLVHAVFALSQFRENTGGPASTPANTSQ